MVLGKTSKYLSFEVINIMKNFALFTQSEDLCRYFYGRKKIEKLYFQQKYVVQTKITDYLNKN
jgi:hypothetical protein